MMRFKDRRDAAKQLCLLLEKYQGKDVVVYALPRGGVVLADEIAKFLRAPLSLLFAHKIGHPHQPEYAIAAVSESGHLVGAVDKLQAVDQAWLQGEKRREMEEMGRRRALYLKGKTDLSLKGKIALIVDDGIATGLTMQAGIVELRERHPQKIVVVVPVSPRSTARLLGAMADDVVALQVPEDHDFQGSVGAYYERFNQVEDDEVIEILDNY